MLKIPGFKASSTAKAAATAGYEMTPALLTAMSKLKETLQVRVDIDAAIAANAQAIGGTKQQEEAAAAAVAEIEVKLAIETDTLAVAQLEDDLAAATERMSFAVVAASRAARMKGALVAKAATADAEIGMAKTSFDREVSDFAGHILDSLHDELQRAAQALLVPLAKTHALLSVGLISWTNSVLEELRIPSPSWVPEKRATILDSRHAKLPGGERLDVQTAWPTIPGAEALAEYLAPIATLRREAAAHRPIAPPPPVDHRMPPEMLQAERNREAAERRAAEDARRAALPPPPRFSEYRSTYSPPRNTQNA